MSSLVYYGSIPHGGQIVSEELRSRKINLIREAPSTLNLSGSREFTHPAYEGYVANIALALESARKGVAVKGGERNGFKEYNGVTTPPYMQTPTLAWNYTEKKPSDFIDRIKERFNARETVCDGKPALMATLTRAQARSLVQDTSPNCNLTASNISMNISTFKVYLRLHAIAHSILRMNQYPLVASGTIQDYMVECVALSEMEEVEQMFYYRKSTTRTFHINLPEAYATFKTTISSTSDIPVGDGLLFPYVEDLAKEDPVMVPDLFRVELFGLLGNNYGDACTALQAIVTENKAMMRTTWGKELAHLYSGIRLMLATGAAMKVLLTSQDVYGGFYLWGSKFSVFRGPDEFPAQTRDTIIAEFGRASPHGHALMAIFELLNYDDDIERQGARQACTSMADVSRCIRERGYNVNDKEKIANNLRNVLFLKDKYLSITANNVARVLTVIGQSFGDEEIPVHHLAAFEVSRNRRLWSGFGASAPSFLLEGGRKMELTGSFSFKKAIGGSKKQDVAVTTMYVVVKSLEKAWEDLDTVLAEKYVLSAAGIMHRASARAMVREFNAALGTEVLAALRMAAKVEMPADPTPASGNKRARDEDDDENARVKRVKAAFDL